MRARAVLLWMLWWCFALGLLWAPPSAAQSRPQLDAGAEVTGDAGASASDAGDAGAGDAGSSDSAEAASTSYEPERQVVLDAERAAEEAEASRSWRTPEHDALIGKPIRFVEVVLTAPAQPSEVFRRLIHDVSLPEVTSVKRGEPFTQAAARAAMRDVLQSGDFASAKVSAEPEGDGVRVIVEVIVRKVISAVVVTSFGARVDREELLRDAELGKGRELTGDRLEYHRDKIRNYMARRGFPRALVNFGVAVNRNERQQVALVITVMVGEASRASEVVFDYVNAAEARDSSGREKQPAVARALAQYPFTRGSGLDEDRLDAADLELQAQLRTLGYHNAEVRNVIDVHGSNGPVLHVRVKLGAFYTLRFEGNDHYDDDALRGALDLAEESDRSGQHLASKVQDFYVQRGFLDVEVEPSERSGAGDLVRTLVFRIFEHRRVEVRTRRYPCFSADSLKGISFAAAPRTVAGIGNEIDSFLQEEMPGEDLLRSPRPSGLSALIGGGGSGQVDPYDLDPAATFSPDTYQRALSHVRDLFRAEGYLNVEVGPMAVLRRRCDKRSPPGRCLPVATPQLSDDSLCRLDPRGLPLPAPEPEPAETCVPDPEHNVLCESKVDLRIPIQLGPRSVLYEVTFSGVRALAPKRLFSAMKLTVGKPASTVKLEEARRRLIEVYREEGYAFAEARFSLEFSTDHTRVRARFDVTESERVLVRNVVVVGLERTKEYLVRKRLALEICADQHSCEPYRTSLVRKSEERIGQLGVFSSVSVTLENPHLPEKWKTVIVTVAERTTQVLELRAGFSSGQGLRWGGEYGHRNIFGHAISASLLAEFSYLPTFFIREFIRDPILEENFVNILGDPGFSTRTAARVTGSIQFPETGLGPLFRGVLDGVFVHDLQRDYYVRKFAVIPSLTFTPARILRFTGGQSVEFNAVRVFQASNLESYLGSLASSGRLTVDRAARLLVPDGSSVALAQKVTAAWDRRDNSLDATRGTFVALTVEHVDAFPLGEATGVANLARESHFLKVVQTVSGYIPLYKRLRLALSVRAGANLQLTRDSVTYPDRLFFLGGADSMRAWYQTTFMPQDDADRVMADRNKPDTIANPNAGQPNEPDVIPNPDKFTEVSRPVRGGNLLFNPRAELRIPLGGAIETVGFFDVGNLWTDVAYPFSRGEFPLRYAVGSGLRIQTPVFPIVFDVGFNPSRRYFERAWAFNFAIGLF